ncbi:LysE family translocator [Vogesella sp. LIG4]|uniref:LysE family translocator n=1 Tax=Vogesella sp. LIG4 TaxID=1192162 RepID=UPI00081FBD2B|nr:LysE family translocator [Vogesella sp. LIG4]SCK19984.1 Threonine/homoserine/homoserine lactone efflux protein [Vogesella sp. LIG4]
MSFTALLLFLPACFAINMAPGPNNLLSISNATRYGFSRACLAGAGRLLAFAGMIALAAAGLAVLLLESAVLFTVIKLVGAGYLFWLAIQLWRAPLRANAVRDARPPLSLLALARQEFLVAAGNPKAILVFTAFLPQFVDATRPVAAQFLQLGCAFLLLEVVAIAIYSALGTQLNRWLATARGQRLFNRGCGVLLGGAGMGLLLARR